uniref:Pentatricopeptide repeat-containing protein n=1 Tax=Kalanchoe fedtschenkoi TaxID=63787 RepID=A0A7N0SVR8_KALFE
MITQMVWTANARRLFSSATLTDELHHSIIRLRSPAANVLQNWADQGRKINLPQVKRFAYKLVKARRHQHALQVFSWLEGQHKFRMSPSDFAIKLDVIAKVKGLSHAQDYFDTIHNMASQKAASIALLRVYVLERNVLRAETLMVKLTAMGLVLNCHPYNEMMKLYIATAQFVNVLAVISLMKQNKIPLNVLSYNLWITACSEVSGVDSCELVYKEMLIDEKVTVGWTTLSTLANIYVKAGLLQKASHNESVLRLWKASKAVGGKIPCANYICVLSCLVKLGDLSEAEKLFLEWESNCWNYDIRVSNVLLAAYMRNGLMEKAESLHFQTLERGGCPNYKTWEILMEGRIKCKNMEKAVEAMNKCFALIENIKWRPSNNSIMAVAKHFEKCRNYEDAQWLLSRVHHLGFASLPLYKIMIRMHLSNKKSASDILQMMKIDGIEIDDETSNLLQAYQT